MVAVAEQRLAFEVSWKDPRTDVVFAYRLFYFPETDELEMVEAKSRKLFLKRCNLEGTKIVPQLLRPGAILTILSRQLYVTGYADEFTASQLQAKQERTLGLIKPDAVQHLPEFLAAIHNAGFLTGQLRLCHLTKEEAEQFYDVHEHQPFYARLIDFMSRGPIVAMELLAEEAMTRWRQLIGPTDSEAARAAAPDSLRALYGTDKTRNACHGSDSTLTADSECSFFFSKQIGRCWGAEGSCLCIVKPHVVAADRLHLVLAAITERFRLTGMRTCNFGSRAAGKLLEIYKGVLPLGEYSAAVEEMGSGASVALELACPSGNTSPPVEALRQFCGPHDPDLARRLRPDSLRARFGINRAQNGVHCTELEEDARRDLECAFMA